MNTSGAPAPTPNRTRGILYIVFGEGYVKEACLSAESAKAHMPDIPITFLTDSTTVRSPYIDHVQRIVPKHIRTKVDYMSQTPYDQTLYLDSDTYLARSVVDIFEVLEKFDIAFTQDISRKREFLAKQIPEYGEIPYSFSEINTGVIAFNRNERTDQLWDLWRQFFYKYQGQFPYDQMSFRVALWRSLCRAHYLPGEYNLRSRQNRKKVVRYKRILGEGHMEPRIFHMHCDKLVKEGRFRVRDLKQAIRFCRRNFHPY